MRPAYTIKRLQDTSRAVRMTSGLRKRERLNREDLLSFQAGRLASLIRHASSASPFYRERFGRQAAERDVALKDLPVLAKTVMMENFDRLVTDSRLRLSELEKHVEGLSRDEYYAGRYRVLVTGGTSGVRGLFVYDRPEWSTAIASALRSASTIGFSPRIPNRLRWAFVGAPGSVHMSNRLPASADAGLYRMLRLEATRPVGDLVRSLNEFQPDILQTYPSVGAVLAFEQQEGRLHIRPRFVTTTAEMRTPQMEVQIQEAWGVRPYNLYAMTEVGIVGSDCPEHEGIHLNEDLAIFEVVDEDNRPVPPGATGHKVLVTNLFNYTQPLIRYEISDMLTMAPKPCPCGRSLALVKAIEGRSDDMLLLRGLDGRLVPVHPIHLRSPLGARRDVRQYQIVHDIEGLHVMVVLARGAAGADSIAGVTDSLRKSLSRLPIEPPPIDVQVVDSIPREGGHAAKFKIVRSLVGTGSDRVGADRTTGAIR